MVGDKRIRTLRTCSSCSSEMAGTSRAMVRVNPEPATPLIDRTRRLLPARECDIRVRAVYYQLEGRDNHVYGFVRATRGLNVNSFVVITSNGIILTRDALRSVVRVLTIPHGLPIKFQDIPGLYIVGDTAIGDDENIDAELRSRLEENDHYVVRISDIAISEESMMYIKSFQDGQIAKTVNLADPWGSLA